MTVSGVAPGSDLPRGRRTLSSTPRPDAQVHHRPHCGASHPRLHQQAARERARRKGARAFWRREHEPRRGRASRVSALYGAGLRPSLRPVSGSTSLLEASQKGRSSLPTASHRRPPIGGEPPHPASVTLLGETGGKDPRASRNSSGFLSRSTMFNAACCLRGGWLRAWRCGVDGVVVEIGCGDVGCSKITTAKEKRLSQSVAAR